MGGKEISHCQGDGRMETDMGLSRGLPLASRAAVKGSAFRLLVLRALREAGTTLFSFLEETVEVRGGHVLVSGHVTGNQ